LKPKEILEIFRKHPVFEQLNGLLTGKEGNIYLKGMVGSGPGVLLSALFDKTGRQQHLVILSDKEQAAYFYNDLENLLGDADTDIADKKVLFYPTTYKRPYEPENTDAAYQLSRTEVLNRFLSGNKKTIVVSYPEALAEKVITKQYLNKNTMRLKTGEAVSQDFVIDLLLEYGFERVDFVAEPGQFAIRGSLIDIFSFSNEHPFRIEFFGDEVESIRSFDPVSQLSVKKLNNIVLLPNIQDRHIAEKRVPFPEYIPGSTVLWFHDIHFTLDKIEEEFKKAEAIFTRLEDAEERIVPEDLFIHDAVFLGLLKRFKIVEFGKQTFFKDSRWLEFDQNPQPAFNKSFDLLLENIREHTRAGFLNLVFSDNEKQIKRLLGIFEDLQQELPDDEKAVIEPVNTSISGGFIDKDLKLLCYTDHQIFERYHRFKLRESFGRKEAITLKELYDLKPGDFVTHIDHGVGRFDGLQIIDNNGKKQEVVRLIYKNNDILYVSIHSLHRISKYVGKEGTPPTLNKLGSNNWAKLKSKTKKRVKDIARDLIKLYAQRRVTKGFAFSPDSYLQTELEASFFYEDTPDQYKATQDIKRDMEADFPMDRLICGDVGFGKTEVAIRAAFKAVADSKQVAVLVPTTVLAMQHAITFSERLKDFPVTVDYINRFKSAKQQKETLAKLKEGKVDILIGTHRLISKDVVFKDLGLLIIDEEQKFGVAAKEKLRQMKSNVDTLTLTATPIPRTLQFSLMGARDLSIINTPPPNRYPVQTELRSFGSDVIRDAIEYEVARGGQVFFVHNRVQNIMEVYDMIHKFVPGVRIGVAHGQMEGRKLEQIMRDFIEGRYDVLLATTIIESGLDIPNANTIIINDSQNYGLSDLHQLRGRVGRTNRKAFCYLLSPPLSVLTPEARKRLQALVEFSDLGSGFNIAMRDLDIRGAGNILGGEQSGFISDIGFDMFHKILDEAIAELKQSEFEELFKETGKEGTFVKDCQLETDLEVLLPNDYVTNIQERLSLYKELENAENEEMLTAFSDHLQDRFGPIPPQTEELINTLRLRWIGREIGFEKIVLKSNRLSGVFTGDSESGYFQTEAFGKVLDFIKNNPTASTMKEVKGKLTMRFDNVRSVKEAIEVLNKLVE
jgi:transcription-repair coupling factor (superfamily II helicase)